MSVSRETVGFSGVAPTVPECRPPAEGHRSSARAQSVVTVSAARGERVMSLCIGCVPMLIGRRGEPSSESAGACR